MAPRTWLITGCSSGFGRRLAEVALGVAEPSSSAAAALAARALERGDQVVATARRPDALGDLVALAPDRVLAVALDVTSPAAIAAAVAAAEERFGGIDVLVNNAGFGSVGAIEEIEPEHLRDVMETMFFGAGRAHAGRAAGDARAGLRRRRADELDGRPALAARLRRLLRGEVRAGGGLGVARGRGRAARPARADRRAGLVPHRVRRRAAAPVALARPPTPRPSARTGSSSTGSTAARRATRGWRPRPSRPRSTPDEPPLRLALGGDAVAAIRGALEARLAELARWEEASRATAFAAERGASAGRPRSARRSSARPARGRPRRGDGRRGSRSRRRPARPRSAAASLPRCSASQTRSQRERAAGAGRKLASNTSARLGSSVPAIASSGISRVPARPRRRASSRSATTRSRAPHEERRRERERAARRRERTIRVKARSASTCSEPVRSMDPSCA